MILMKNKTRKKEKIVAKRVQILITMISCLQLVIALPIVVVRNSAQKVGFKKKSNNQNGVKKFRWFSRSK